MNNHILYQSTDAGGRLKYFRVTADSAYWDAVWREQARLHDYGRARAGHMPSQMRRTFLRWLRPPARVLEAGCGLADFTVAANALGYEAVGVDWASNTISTLRSRFPDIPFFVGDVRKLTTIQAESFDAVYSPGVCEHFEEGPEDTLRETHRVLRSGGFAVVSTPCLNRFRKLIVQLGGLRDTPNAEFYPTFRTSA